VRQPILSLLLASLLATAAHASGAPADDARPPLAIIVPFGKGSSTDLLAHALAEGMHERTGRVVTVSNMGGASGIKGAQSVALAKPDGNTVLLGTNTTHAANEHLYKNLPYDPVRQFAPVTGVVRGALMMLVRPQFPAASLREFIIRATVAPNRYRFGSGSSSSRVAGNLLEEQANIKLRHVPYASNPLAVADLISGQVSLAIVDIATALPELNKRSVRALAVTSAKRLALKPEIPTAAEAGLPGYEIGYWTAVYAPAGTPCAIVEDLNKAFIDAMQSKPVQDIFRQTGGEIFATTPAELAAFQATESEKWGRAILQAGLAVE